MKILWCILLLVCLCSMPAFAQAPDIEIYGNHTLDDETIIRMTDLELNPNLSDVEVRRKLETTSLFSTVRVRREGDTINIIVKEKTSWFVLPYYYSDSSLSVYGLAGGMSDLFGQDAYAVGRYQTGSQNHVGSLAYRDEFFQNSLWIMGLVFEYENALHDYYQGRDVAFRLPNKFTGYNFQFGRHLSPKVDVELDTHFETHNFENLDGTYSHGVQLSQRLLADFGNYYLNEGLARGKTLRTYVEYTLPGSTYKFVQFGVSAADSMYVNGDFNWIIRPKAEYAASIPRYQLFELGAGRLRGYSTATFRDHGYGEVQNDFLLTSFNILKMKVRPMVFTDFAYIENGGRPAVGGGLQIFFPKVVVPAIQVYGG